MPAMIVMKKTPQGFKLIPATECRGSSFRVMGHSDSMAFRTKEVMDELMLVAKHHRLYNASLKELFDLAIRKNDGSKLFGNPMQDVKLLPSSGETPARLLINP
jgi:hypothetical protein